MLPTDDLQGVSEFVVAQTILSYVNHAKADPTDAIAHFIKRWHIANQPIEEIKGLVNKHFGVKL